MKPSFLKGDKVKNISTGIEYEIMMNADRTRIAFEGLGNPCIHTSGNAGYAFRVADQSDNFVWILPKDVMEERFIRTKTSPTKAFKT